jgi:hypothetical protein
VQLKVCGETKFQSPCVSGGRIIKPAPKSLATPPVGAEIKETIRRSDTRANAVRIRLMDMSLSPRDANRSTVARRYRAFYNHHTHEANIARAEGGI